MENRITGIRDRIGGEVKPPRMNEIHFLFAIATTLALTARM